MNKKSLNVNIDQVAVLRQSKGTSYPEPLQAAYMIQNAGACGISLSSKEDKYHMQKRDLYLIREACSLPLTIEIVLHDDMIHRALDLCPEEVCIVPESQEKLITEEGLDILVTQDELDSFISKAQSRNIKVSLVINHDDESIKLASELGADIIMLHAGSFTNAITFQEQERIFEELKYASQYAHSLGLQVNVGKKINYEHIDKLKSIAEIHTFYIGHAIISRAFFVGLDRSVRDMIALLG